MRRFWINTQFPLDTFIDLLSKHLKTFRELEALQAAALKSVKSQVVDGLTEVLGKQNEVITAITNEKSSLKPYLDQWESLDAKVREKLRSGKAGEILLALETVAHSIQSKHQEMFGGEENKSENLSQTINIYRAMH